MIAKLQLKGAVVEYNDPFFQLISPTRERFQLTDKNSFEIKEAYDLNLLSTDNEEYKIFDFTSYSCPLVDYRNCICKRPQKFFQT